MGIKCECSHVCDVEMYESLVGNKIGSPNQRFLGVSDRDSRVSKINCLQVDIDLVFYNRWRNILQITANGFVIF